MIFSLEFPHAWGGPLGTAHFRTRPEDFVVDEELGFKPEGSGEHLFLHLRKRNQNTRWVAEQLAALAGIEPVDIGFSGMKDRRAVTSQWFSLYLPKRDPDLSLLSQIEGVELLASRRHSRKLRRGDHRANHFVIRLRQCSVAKADFEQRLRHIAVSGVPNYYGEQRFGHDCNNLIEFERRFVNGARKSRRGEPRKRDQGLYLSAGRSWVFNRILATRVERGTWNVAMESEARPEGALWGRGRSTAVSAVSDLEQQVIDTLPGWGNALEHSGLAQERRPLVLIPEEFNWKIKSGDVVLDFSLLPGHFATSVLRELVRVTTPDAAHGIVLGLGGR